MIGSEDKLFTKLYKEYFKPLCYYAYRIIKDQLRASDIVQDCFLKVWKQHERFSEIKDFKNYLSSAVHNQCIYEATRQTWLRKKLLKIDQGVSGDIPIDESIIRIEYYSALHKSVERLPEIFKTIVQAYYFDRMSSREIAKAFDIPMYTVRARKARALKLLQKAGVDI